MRLLRYTNSELVIQANHKKEGDYAAAIERANRIEANSQGRIVIAAIEDDTQIVHMTAVWDNYGASELKDEYDLSK